MMSNNDKNGRTEDDDEVVLWENMQLCQRKIIKLMEDEKGKLQNEIDTMNSAFAVTAVVSNDDIIEIDAGGKIMRALRSTLTSAPDTMFSSMFSRRWEESLKRSSNGRVFLDEDSELIEIIINFLR